MATGKKYYWIKLRKDFLTGDTVDFLMSQKNGAQYVVLYQMLCIMCINTNGELFRQIGEVIIPFDVDKIQRDCKYFSRDTVAVALGLFKRLGLIYEQNPGSLIISNFDDMIGSESDYAKQKRMQRQSGQIRGHSSYITIDNIKDDDVDNVHDNVLNLSIQSKSIEKEIEKDKIKREFCPEPESPSLGPPVISLPLNDKSYHEIYQRDIDVWKELYPSVDILQELRKMRGWLDSNPTRKKTRRGIKRFINSWLAKEQDRSHAILQNDSLVGNTKPVAGMTLEAVSGAEEELIEGDEWINCQTPWGR